MTTKTITLQICDMPHDDDVDGAMPVTITTPDGTWSVDLCPDHAAHFLMPGAPGRGARKPHRCNWTVDQINPAGVGQGVTGRGGRTDQAQNTADRKTTP